MNSFNINTYKLSSGQHVVCFIDPTTGRRVRKKFKSLIAAKDHKQELELRFKVKGLQALSSEPVARLMELHLEKCPDTKVRDRKNAFVSFCNSLGHHKMSDLGKTELQGWFFRYQEENKLSDKTMNRIKCQLSSFFKFLKDEGFIQHSPLTEVKFKPNPPMVRPRIVLSVEEVKAVLENAKKFSPDYLYPYLYTAANVGARRSEIIRLRREDVDFSTGLLHFRKTKNGEDRSIRMSQSLTGLLKAHIATHSSEFVFPSPEGRMIGRSQIQRLLDKFQKHFPLGKEWGLHSLRHSFAYNYLKKGGEMYQLQAVLGHKHIQVTVNLYGQLKAQDVVNISPYETE
jgi:integrase/recombinase XerD